MHSPASLYEAFDPEKARRLTEKLEIHHTPKHGSWLNIAEIELSVLQRVAMRMGRMGSWADESVLRRPSSEDRGRHRAGHAQGPGGPHVRGGRLDRQALRHQGPERRTP